MSEDKAKRGATDQQLTIGNLIAGLFAILGIGVIVIFVYSVLNNPKISGAETSNRLILEFLDGYGLIIPLLVFGLGLVFVNFARLLYARDILASGWAQLTAFWLMVASVIIIFVHLFQVLTANVGAAADDRINVNFGLIGSLIVLGAVTGFMARWIAQNREVVFTHGEETIASRESLTAWNLLIPTVVVMLLVAARPLERTFIGSLTDRTFAGAADEEVNFIGLQNYSRLLGFRVDSIDCVRDEANECTTRTVNNEAEEVVSVAVDLDGLATLEPATLDVGLDFFLPETLNRLLAENESFKTVLEAAAKAAIEEESGATVGAVEVVRVVEGNLVEVTADGATQQVAITNRLTELEGLDFADVDLNYASDVSLAGLNTYRIRSRTLRDELSAIAATQFNPETDETIDDVAIAGFTGLDAMDVTVTRIATSTEVVYEDPRDTVGDAYRNFARVGTINLLGNRWVISARDAAFFVAIGNTLFFAFVTVIAELFLGMVIALTVNSSFPGRGLMRAAMLIPWAIPTVVSAKLWEYMLLDNRSGVINDLLVRFGIIDGSIAWFANANTRIWSLIFVDVWKTTPFMALLILAGLQTIPGDIYEAADVDGASKVRQFFSVTLPLLRPTIAVALVFRTLDAVRAFDVFDVLLGRQLQSMATYNQFVLVETQEFGYASAIGVTMFVIILVFTIIYVRALGVDTD
jgi:trehalose/maltose transport system permease protein